jgi:hypothetical protein
LGRGVANDGENNKKREKGRNRPFSRRPAELQVR